MLMFEELLQSVSCGTWPSPVSICLESGRSYTCASEHWTISIYFLVHSRMAS